MIEPTKESNRDVTWHYRQCFGCGPDNPHGLHASFPFDLETGEVRFTYTPLAHLQGAPGYVHGGVLSALLDEGQGALCFHAGYLPMTDQLHLKYHLATPIDRDFVVRCWISAVRKRRLYTRATLSAPSGELLVSSSAAFYILPERLGRKMMSISEEDAARVRAVLDANRKRAREIRRRLRETTSSPAP